MWVIEHLKSFKVLRIYSLLTLVMLLLSILLSTLGAFTHILIQTVASGAIIVGTILELFQILIVIQLTDRDDKFGWILHRFAYVTLVIMIYSFLSIVGGSFLASFSISGGDIMIIAVIGYVMQASFGICLSSVTYHFTQIEDAWL